MKTLRNTLLTLILGTCATASLTAMDKSYLSAFNSNKSDDIIEELVMILYENNNNPAWVFTVLQKTFNRYGNTACLEILKQSLIRARTSLGKIKDEQGNTVLHLACSTVCTASEIQMILDTESSAGLLFIRNKNGEIAYDLAKRNYLNDINQITRTMIAFAQLYELGTQLLDQAAPEKPKLITNNEYPKQNLMFQPKEQDTTESFGLGF